MRKLFNTFLTAIRKGVNFLALNKERFFQKKILLAAAAALVLILGVWAWSGFRGGTSQLVGTWFWEANSSTSYSHHNFDVLELFKDESGVWRHTRGLGPTRHFKWKAENGNLYMLFENVIDPNTSSRGVSGGISFFGINLGMESSSTKASAADAVTLPYNLSWSTLTLNDKYEFKKVNDLKAALEAKEARELAARPKELTIADLKGGPGVYVLTYGGSANANGKWQYGSGGAVWKDGKKYNMPEPSNDTNINSLLISGDNVYIVGMDGYANNSYKFATLWTNGARQALDTVASRALELCVHNNDVYVAGVRGLDKARKPVLWKNGNLQTLAPSDPWQPSNNVSNKWSRFYQEPFIIDPSKLAPSYISVFNGNRYIVGIAGDTKRQLNNLVIWKNEENGKILNANSYNNGVISDNLFTLDDDVYIATYKDDYLRLYKNDKVQKEIKSDYYYGHSEIRSIYTSNENIYIISNYRRNHGLWKWKAGEKQFELQKLEGFENPETLEKIQTEYYRVFAVGGNVYVFGARSSYDAGGIKHPMVNVLWKNGKAAEVFTTDIHRDSIASFLVVE